MKKTIPNLTLIICFLICSFSYGQNNMEDVVYLKNGSIIRGIIIEQIPNQSLKIQTKDRNVFFFKLEDIEKITKENVPSSNVSTPTPLKLEDLKKRGYINITEINYGFGVGTFVINNNTGANTLNCIGITTMNGFQFNEHLVIGAGVGYENYSDTKSNYNANYLNLSVDGRAYLLKGRLSPAIDANVGYDIGLSGQTGGFTINPSIGLKYFISKNTAYLFNIGYKLEERTMVYSALSWQSYNGITNTWSSAYHLEQSNVFFQYLTFRTGFSF